MHAYIYYVCIEWKLRNAVWKISGTTDAPQQQPLQGSGQRSRGVFTSFLLCLFISFHASTFFPPFFFISMSMKKNIYIREKVFHLTRGWEESVETRYNEIRHRTTPETRECAKKKYNMRGCSCRKWTCTYKHTRAARDLTYIAARTEV